METVIIIILYLGVVFGDFIPMMKEKDKKRTWIYGIALSLSFCVLFLVSVGVDIPGPSGLIKTSVEKVLKIRL